MSQTFPLVCSLQVCNHAEPVRVELLSTRTGSAGGYLLSRRKTIADWNTADKTEQNKNTECFIYIFTKKLVILKMKMKE